MRAARLVLVSPRSLNRIATPFLQRVGASFGPDVTVRDLSTGQRQLVEIAKALAVEPKAIVFDEPTASLNPAERNLVFAIVERLRSEGVAILYVTHFLEEIARLSQRVVAMRDGRIVADRPTRELDRGSLESLMVGRELAKGYPLPLPPSEEVTLSVRGLGDNTRISEISFDIPKGEIFGLAGLMGSGRTEVAKAIFGVADRVGQVDVCGRRLQRGDVRAAIEAGIAFITEDRRSDGLFLERPIRGSPLLLNIVGAVVLGGTSLFGGRGSIVRTAIGVLLLGFLSNSMNLLGLQSYDQQMVTGGIIFLAASADGLMRWLRPRLRLSRTTSS